MLSLDAELRELKGVGDSRAVKLKEAGLETVGDLLDFWPRRYVDYSKIDSIAEIRPGPVVIFGNATQIRQRWAKGRSLHLTEAVVEDPDGEKMPVTWFNQPFRKDFFKAGRNYYFSGEFKFGGGSLSLSNPRVEDPELVEKAPILPIYPEKKGLNSNLTRSLMLQAVEARGQLGDIFGPELRESLKLKRRSELVMELHFPESMQSLAAAKRALALEELIILRLAVDRFRLGEEELKAEGIEIPLSLIKKAVEGLPFKLTDSQRRVAWSIMEDLQKDQPMNRLLMGDVGSGKTVVAALAALAVIGNGGQVVVMAPTEVLAQQHYATLLSLIGGLIGENKIGLLLGSMKQGQKRELKSGIESGSLSLIVATHAILSDQIIFKKLNLIVVDEQQRFGVEQRRALQKRLDGEKFPHLLTMSATPIPRSLSLVLYGELEQSVLKEKPLQRGKVETKLVLGGVRREVESKMKEELEKGHQVFVVCPAITDTEASDRVSVERVAESLEKKAFARRAGVRTLHAKLKAGEKDKIMADFAEGKFGVLVSTTVIEVGVDIPKATVMVIEGGEFFGLAQLHQLRGRIGRSQRDSWCYVLASGTGAPPERLRYFEQESDGFRLAEYDLKLRGPGQIYGKMQSGGLDLRMVDLEDSKLIEEAKAAAEVILASGKMPAKLKAAVEKHQGLESLN